MRDRTLIPLQNRYVPAAHMETLKRIQKAITQRKSMAFVYHGHPRLEVAPHILGFSPQHHLMLSAYQYKGSSESSSVPGWKNFFIEDMRSVRIISRPFRARPDYNPEDPSFAAILAQI